MYAAAAAIAALPQLQRLKVAEVGHGASVLAQLQLCQLGTQLKHLSLRFADSGPHAFWCADAASCSPLSQLVRLRSLKFGPCPEDVVLGRIISQLTDLTSLVVYFRKYHDDGVYSQYVNQLQHLSHLTALQHLSVTNDCVDAGDSSAIPQLTRLQLQSKDQSEGGLDFSDSSPNRWTRLTALQDLTLTGCRVPPVVPVILSKAFRPPAVTGYV